ncbi:MAG: hypothetical protein V1770_02290 [bacterium]
MSKPRQIVTLSDDGKINSEFEGFQGTACLQQAAEIAKELEELGIISSVESLEMKDTAETQAVSQQQTAEVKIERG